MGKFCAVSFCLDGAPMADGGAKPRSGAFAPYKPVERLFINCHRLQCQDAPRRSVALQLNFDVALETLNMKRRSARPAVAPYPFLNNLIAFNTTKIELA